MHSSNGRYIPALRYDWLTPFYDPLLRWGMREDRFKRRLIDQAQIQAGQRVLDLGCGTATLTIQAKQHHPGAEVVGLDGDARVLAIGRAKAARAGVQIRLVRGLAYQLPYGANTFDRVLSSLVLHHLTREGKQRALHEALRVLRSGGELHVVDFGQPHDLPAHLMSLLIQRFEEASDNVKGLLPEMFHRAGFVQVEETTHFSTIVGGLSLYRAQKPT